MVMQKRKMQVFVSSTFTDLVTERQAAVAAILKAGHIPAGMELFTAGDKSQLETIKRWIDESDVYMLILGGRYGSLEPITGISYTELEYDYAAQQGKPLFAVVINEQALEEKVRSFGSSVIEKDNPQQLKPFRQKVLSNISSFFSDEKDIRLTVHESLADLRDNPLIKGWISAGDIEDTKPLHDEITALREANRKLTDQAAQALKRTPDNTKIQNPDYQSLIDVLRNTDVKLPDHVAGNGPKQNNALALMYSNRDILVNGVTNSMNSGEAETFFYYNLCPKLIVHGLVDNEKVPGTRYRRSSVNEKGIALLAELERRVAQIKAADASESDAASSADSQKET